MVQRIALFPNDAFFEMFADREQCVSKLAITSGCEKPFILVESASPRAAT
jgi:hypothetical protein